MRYLLMVLSLAWAVMARADMAIRYVAVSATSTNTATTLSLPVKTLLVDNIGPNDVYINLSGSGVAVASGDTNAKVRAGTAVVFEAGAGELITKVGSICAATETASVGLTGTR